MAILGVAVLVALQAREVSRVTSPLVGRQRLWRLDVQRSVQEMELREVSLIGFDAATMPLCRLAPRAPAGWPLRSAGRPA